MNERIRAREIRVVDEEGKQLGIMAPFEALRAARERGLDLVEVSPTANPPVCRIINYGKFLYQQSKRQHEARKHQRSVELKEVKFRPRTGAHDLEVKRNQINRFLQDGSKVKATIMFRGREMAHRSLGWEMMQRLINELDEVAQVEIRPRQEGPNLTTILAPKKVGGKSMKPALPRAAGAATQPKPVGSAPGTSGPAAAAPARSAPAGAGPQAPASVKSTAPTETSGR